MGKKTQYQLFASPSKSNRRESLAIKDDGVPMWMRRLNFDLPQESIDRWDCFEYDTSAVVFGFWFVANAAAGKVKN